MTSRLVVAVDYPSDPTKADAFISKLEERIGDLIDELQDELDFYPESAGEDSGIFIVPALSDECAAEGGCSEED